MNLFLTILITAAALCAVVLWQINRSIRVERVRIVNPRVPGSFEGCRILLMADLHDKRFGKDDRRLLYRIRALNPDLIVMAGDMHSSKSRSRAFVDLVAQLGATGLPIFFVEGNHDVDPGCAVEYQTLMRRLAENGVTVLHNAKPVYVRRDKDRIAVSGLGWFDAAEYAQPTFDRGDFNVFIRHDPLTFDAMTDRPDLMLSGHVHGGYVRLPGVGALFAPGNNVPLFRRFHRQYFLPKYSRGMYRRVGCDLVVSQGLGNSVIPFRLIRPELTLLTLHA